MSSSKVHDFVNDTKRSFLSASLISSIKIGIFERVQQNNLTINQLIDELHMTPNIARAVINVLISNEYLTIKDGKCYIGPNTIPILDRLEILRGWFDEMHLVMTALPVLDKLLLDPNYENPVKSFWTYKSNKSSEQSEQIATYSRNMDTSQPLHAATVLRTLDFSKYKTLIEFGGGYGCFSMHLAQKYPNLKITIIDLPEVVSTTVKRIAEAGLTDQINCIGIDFINQTVPGSYDVAIFNRVLHDWSDNEANILLNKARTVVKEIKGDVIIAENMDPAESIDPSSAATHLMLALLGGKRRQTYEIERMLLDHGCSKVTISYTNESILHVAVGHH